MPPTINVFAPLEKLDKMQAKARYQLMSQLIIPINEWFGRPPESKEEALQRRDPNYLDPKAKHRAQLAFGCFMFLLLLLFWFITTCRNSKNAHSEYMRQNQDEDKVDKDTTRFGEFFGDDSDDEVDQETELQTIGGNKKSA